MRRFSSLKVINIQLKVDITKGLLVDKINKIGWTVKHIESIKTSYNR